MSTTVETPSIRVPDKIEGNMSVAGTLTEGVAARIPPRRDIAVGLAVAIVGAVIAFAGLVAFLGRVQLAAALLGAHFLFGVPLTSTDAAKVLFVAIGAVSAMLFGGLTIVAGVAVALIVYGKNR